MTDTTASLSHMQCTVQLAQYLPHTLQPPQSATILLLLSWSRKIQMVRPLNLKPLTFPNCSTPPPSRSIAPDPNLRILSLHLKQHGYPIPWAKKCMPPLQISSEGFIKPNIMKRLFSNCLKLNYAPQKPSTRPHHLTHMRQMANHRLEFPLPATSLTTPLSH